jgi:hypothetical protein
LIKIKHNIKKVIKAKIGQSKPITPSKPILTDRGKEILRKQEVIKNMDFEYRSNAIQQLPKQDRAFTMSNPEFGNRDDRERHILEYKQKIESFKTMGYKRNDDVDYEILICISSYNRFDKVEKLLKQFYGQNSFYSFKIILLDDASSDTRYEQLQKTYPQLEYLRNKKNNGRDLYWYTVTQLWKAAKHYSSNMLLMIDDDFVLGNNFLTLLGELFFDLKAENNSIVGIAPHLHSYHTNILFMGWWYNTYSCDGVCLFDRNFIEEFDYQLQPVSKNELDSASHAHGWSQIQKKIYNENKIAYKTKISIAFHDGNDESKLGAGNKQKTKANTHYFKNFVATYKDLKV